MGILDGKNILVTGVTMNTSIAYKVAEVAEQQGATVIVTAFGRALRLATKVVQKLDPVPQVIEARRLECRRAGGAARQAA